MQEGSFVAVWLSSGRYVTRLKNARATIANAIVAQSRKEMEETLAEKLGKVQSEGVGIFQFMGLSATGSVEKGDAVLRNARPITAFAAVISTKELQERFNDTLKLSERDGGGESLWVECFVRHKTRKDGDDGGAAPPRARGRFRRD